MRFGFASFLLFVGLSVAAACADGDNNTDDDDSSSGGSASSLNGSGAGTTNGSGGSGGTGGGSGGSVMAQTLDNHGPCTQKSEIVPASNETGHYAAATLTPTSWPMRVDEVKVTLKGNLGGPTAPCDADGEHKVMVFASPPGKPLANPVASVDVFIGTTPPSSEKSTTREVTLTVDPPIWVEQGENVVVALEMLAGSCIRTCDDNPKVGANWWSNAAMEPYPWGDLVADFNLATDYTISAISYGGE